MRAFLRKQLFAFNFKMYVARNERKQVGPNAKIQISWPTMVGWPNMSDFYANGSRQCVVQQDEEGRLFAE